MPLDITLANSTKTVLQFLHTAQQTGRTMQESTDTIAKGGLELSSETARLIERASHVMSSRQSNVRALAEPSIFVESGQGQRVWDVDGKEWLDFAIAMGPGIWGHGCREYLDVIHAQLDKLLYVQSGACQSRLEVELAEKIVEHVPSAEHVRFHLSGSEAVQMALRLARAFTGKPKFVRFGGHYHGWLDNVIGGVVDPAANDLPYAAISDNDPFYTEGRAEHALEESFLIPWNDIGALKTLLENHGDKIAVLIMEVFNSNGGGASPKPGYLEAVQNLCRQYGVLLCFDEIITGFRTAIGGAQSIVGVTPDLTIFGKAIAGGMPLAAIAGRKDIFNLFKQNKVIGAGTFNAFPVSIAAGLATIRMLENGGTELYVRRNQMQAKLEAGLRQAARTTGHDMVTMGLPGNFCTHFTAKEPMWTSAEIAANADTGKAMRFRQGLREQGIIQGLGSRWFISFALTDEDVEATISAAARAMEKI
ncbi:MAG TPA: aspartate aminotransferase family protein [Hyphomonadaceae bacterium]|nr:aspartate aminotransferase family protein [Hyphomonadaceae bacterium]